ncbi:MAG: RIP metalloprotease RseP [Neisseria sp.]|nr:RIP metalloprotease RseP [Neisseria sp.]
MLTVLAFVTAILILVSLHEFGHYIVARWCGVKVLRFSVGFGKPFYKKQRGETEWCLAPIPLGGYVKMADTREGNVVEADLPRAFDKQHPAKKIAIVAAGPLTNLLLAFLLYALSFSFGITEIRPFVGTVEPYSIAAQAGFQSGDKIRSVNGEAVDSWEAAQTAILFNAESETVRIAVETETGAPAERLIDIAGTKAAAGLAAQGGHIGLLPFKLTTTLAAVAENSAAARAGLKTGDKLMVADGEALETWPQWVEAVRASAGKKMEIGFERGGRFQTAFLRPDSEERPDGKLIGKAGFAPARDKSWDNAVRYRYYPSAGEAFQTAYERTTGYIGLTLKFFGKLLTGQASTKHISGPLTIADAAGKTAAVGLQSYIEFLALVSVSLGIMNLLPVPVLDGGHLVYYAAEWIRGRPLSEAVQQIGLRIGMALMLMLMFLAFFNDITRLIG